MTKVDHRFDVLHFAKGTKAFEKLEEIIISKQMRNDIPMLSPGQQTNICIGRLPLSSEPFCP